MIAYNDIMFKGVLSIGAYGRSGSGLLLSLLDGHPDCVNFQDTILSGYQDWWSSLKSNKGSYVMEDFIDLYQVIFDPTFIHPSRIPPGAGNDFGKYSNMVGSVITGSKDIYVPKERFTHCLSQIVNQNSHETSSSFFKKLHIALAFALDKPISDRTVIVHGATNGTPQRLDFLTSGFRNNWNLLMVREPVIGHYAQINHWIEENDKDKPENLLPRAIIMMRSYYLALTGWENCTKAIRLEDLHHAPIETIKKIINWVNIPWDDCLLEPTFLGRKWFFSQKEIYKKTFNPDIINSKKYQYLFSASDNYYIARCFKRLYDCWGYSLPTVPNNQLKLIIRFFSSFKIENSFKSSVQKIIFTRMLLIMSLINITKNSKKALLEKIVGERALNKILSSMGKESYYKNCLSKKIIPLL